MAWRKLRTVQSEEAIWVWPLDISSATCVNRCPMTPDASPTLTSISHTLGLSTLCNSNTLERNGSVTEHVHKGRGWFLMKLVEWSPERVRNYIILYKNNNKNIKKATFFSIPKLRILLSLSSNLFLIPLTNICSKPTMFQVLLDPSMYTAS